MIGAGSRAPSSSPVCCGLGCSIGTRGPRWVGRGSSPSSIGGRSCNARPLASLVAAASPPDAPGKARQRARRRRRGSGARRPRRSCRSGPVCASGLSLCPLFRRDLHLARFFVATAFSCFFFFFPGEVRAAAIFGAAQIKCLGCAVHLAARQADHCLMHSRQVALTLAHRAAPESPRRSISDCHHSAPIKSLITSTASTAQGRRRLRRARSRSHRRQRLYLLPLVTTMAVLISSNG